ncbi:MAG: DUF924 domain-containing protein [Alphaproteobacteria bacterium]|nr:DUF924 domain-containing protein [Alphaproteobacteria bacterium]
MRGDEMAEEGESDQASGPAEASTGAPAERPVGADAQTLGAEGPDDEAQAILDFWFGELTPSQWFARDDAVDAMVAERFGALAARVATGGTPHWADSPGGLLAAVIALDQFPRNLYRDDPRAYANDAQAVGLADLALRRGMDEGLGAPARQFLYMPFMHSEDTEDQARCVELFEGLGDETALHFARRHKQIIDRFGRFPHRNAVLDRETTPEEAAFLEEPDSSF